MRVFWTDGSAMPNPGRGGYAVIEIVDGEARPVALGSDQMTTNIKMEGAAFKTAIEMAGEEGCEIHTDSEFWVKTLNEWAPAWEKNGWHKANEAIRNQDGEIIGWKETKIKNLDLVRELYELYHRYPVHLEWVRSHVGTEYNEMADEWANKAREGATLG